MAVYEARVVDMTGTSLGVLEDAVIEHFSWELNEAGGASLTLPTTDADAALVQPGREIQIRRDGTLLWWGPVVRPQAGLRTTTWQCAGLLWYFSRRFMGRADRVNYLTNGDFEAGESSWTFENGVGHTLDTGVKVEGTQSLKLTGATANHNQRARQTSAPWVQYHPYGDALIASTWVYIPSASYLGGAVQDLGLVAIHWRGTEPVNAAYAEIGDDTEKDAWIPLEVELPAVKQGDTVEVRLFPPHGVAYFDLVTLTGYESLSFWPQFDVADIISGIVKYGQQQAPYDFGHGKSNLNIGVSAAPTGEMLFRVYQFAEHRNILDAIQEFVRQGIVDIDIAITPTTRTFTTYNGGKGSSYGTTLELNTNVADFTYSWDGEAAASQVVVLGPGDGPDRPEGGATDPAGFNGLSLEHVESAPDHVTVGELDARAAEQLGVAKSPQIVEVTTMPGIGTSGDIDVGDTVNLNLIHGWINLTGTYRVVQIEVQPKTDQAVLTLNPLP